jgi:hypothetical protein
MALSNTDMELLKKFEESLWRRETRFDNGYMRSILAEDFFEFGRSGKVYDLDISLSAPDQDINATLPLKDFAVHQITENVVLITYISEVKYDDLEVANRSSLWLKTDAGWKLKFHQGTPATNVN